MDSLHVKSIVFRYFPHIINIACQTILTEIKKGDINEIKKVIGSVSGKESSLMVKKNFVPCSCFVIAKHVSPQHSI